jgi:hypothetical protein
MFTGMGSLGDFSSGLGLALAASIATTLLSYQENVLPTCRQGPDALPRGTDQWHLVQGRE